jgi:hypothetical protein
MNRVFQIGSVVLLAGALAVACGKESSSPVSPSGVGQSRGSVTPPGGLKATAPTPVSPTNGVKPAGTLTLVATRSTMPFAPAALDLSYEFQILTPQGAVIYSETVSGGSGSTVSVTPNAALNNDQTYNWRARATYQGAMGPFSANASFVANKPGAFINERTLWDPLDGPGFAARRIAGPHTWIPGEGLRLDAFESHVAYELPNGGRIEEGEFSAIISNTPHNTEGIKTKVFSMTGGYSDATTNYARMSVEKRGEGQTGDVAWRFLTTDGEGAETIGSERYAPGFNNGPYFWQATWRNNFFNVLIREGGPNGPEFYNFGKEYGGFYNPVPHVIWLGFGPNRSGPDSSTLPGMIIKNVWVSWDPRPAYANQ